jgi:hypothetical protein
LNSSQTIKKQRTIGSTTKQIAHGDLSGPSGASLTIAAPRHERSIVDEIKPERMLDAVKILALANKAYFLYVKQSPSEKAKLLNLALSNCAIDAASVYPTSLLSGETRAMGV